MSMMKLARHFGLSLMAVLAVVGMVRADWTYPYADNFSSNKAESDSYRHSVFWPKDAVPLSEPYLSYVEVNGNRGLAFFEYKGRLAELGYQFPISSTSGRRYVRGALTLDVSFPSEISEFYPSRLLYSVSSDGTGWSAAEPLEEGRNEISIFSPNGVCYVLFTGTRAVIDNVAVSLYSASVTMSVPGDFPTIQAAIDAAGDGDVIEVQSGRTYSGPGNRDIDFQGKAITVRSAGGPQTTIIDCGGAAAAADGGHRGFYFHESEGADSVLSGFTIRGGRVFGSEVPPNPLYWTPSASHPIGGGIYCEFSGPTVTDCIIRDCGAEVGGGIGGVGAEPTIVDCTIEQCVAGGLGSSSRSGGRGGAIGLLGLSDATITNCVIRNNTGYYNSYGAGLYIWQSSGVVAGCTFSGNVAPGSIQGGGAYCGGATTEVTLRNCIFSKNRADGGAGLFSEQGRVSVVNCTFAQNEVLGAFSDGALQSTGTDILVTNSIVWGNTGKSIAITGSLSKIPVTYSDVQGGYQGTGNINQDPLFAAVSREDYHLRSKEGNGRYDPQAGRWVVDGEHSPCIDAGDPDAAVGDEPAPNGERINMGAYGGTRQASNGPAHCIYHVDGATGRDWNNGLSREAAFATITEAIETARDGDTVLVWPGVYSEKLTFEGKALTVQSAADAAVLTSPDYAASFFGAESFRSVLANFVITGCGKGAIFCDSASPTLKNLTIVGNKFGVLARSGADPNIINCILWSNSSGDLFQCAARYSDIQTGTTDRTAGNINVDPCFADPKNGDYHLKSRAGRWDPQLRFWAGDDRTSPCIDAGDPREDPHGEPMPNGDRVNMGAYGGTPFASKSD